jgi:hypothetical protein
VCHYHANGTSGFVFAPLLVTFLHLRYNLENLPMYIVASKESVCWQAPPKSECRQLTRNISFHKFRAHYAMEIYIRLPWNLESFDPRNNLSSSNIGRYGPRSN